MTGNDTLAEQVPVVRRPAEGMDERREEQRGIGSAAGDHNVGAATKRFRHWPGAEIGVGGDQAITELVDCTVELHDWEISRFAGIKDVVADDSRDLQRRQPHRPGNGSSLARGGKRIGCPHIGDDLDAFGGTDRQRSAHPLLKQRVVAQFRILQARLLRQRHRALAETLKHQILNIALFGEFDRRLDAIARIARARPDADGSHYFSPK